MPDFSHPPVRIRAGSNGVYDAVYSDDSAAWFIRYRTYALLGGMHASDDIKPEPEYSVESYDTPREALLAFERGPVTYRTNEVAA